MNLVNSFSKKVFKVYGKNYKTKDGTAVDLSMWNLSLIWMFLKMIKFNKSFEKKCGKGKGYSFRNNKTREYYEKIKKFF